jgi:hypothetical protein
MAKLKGCKLPIKKIKCIKKALNKFRAFFWKQTNHYISNFYRYEVTKKNYSQNKN